MNKIRNICAIPFAYLGKFYFFIGEKLRRMERHDIARIFYHTSNIFSKIGYKINKNNALVNFCLGNCYRFLGINYMEIKEHLKLAAEHNTRNVRFITSYMNFISNYIGLDKKEVEKYYDLFNSIPKEKQIKRKAEYSIFLHITGSNYFKDFYNKIKEEVKSHFEGRYLAYIDNIDSEDIFDDFSKFEEFLKHNSEDICFVGNSTEITGKRLGKKIDKFNHVIRFNNFSNRHEFTEDYGNKTTIWARGGNKRVKERYDEQFEKIIFCINNIIHRNLNWLNIMRYKKEGNEITFIPQKYYYELVKILGSQPSIGITMLFIFYKLTGKIDKKQCFAFSFTDHLELGKSSHYFEYFKTNNVHNWVGEKELFERITK